MYKHASFGDRSGRGGEEPDDKNNEGIFFFFYVRLGPWPSFSGCTCSNWTVFRSFLLPFPRGLPLVGSDPMASLNYWRIVNGLWARGRRIRFLWVLVFLLCYVQEWVFVTVLEESVERLKIVVLLLQVWRTIWSGAIVRERDEPQMTFNYAHLLVHFVIVGWIGELVARKEINDEAKNLRLFLSGFRVPICQNNT